MVRGDHMHLSIPAAVLNRPPRGLAADPSQNPSAARWRYNGIIQQLVASLLRSVP
jgi:hypothetical protein